jgi:hypothetical protein
MYHAPYYSRKKGPLTVDELAHPPGPLSPSELRQARLVLALEMVTLVLENPCPQQVREPLRRLAACLRELVR